MVINDDKSALFRKEYLVKHVKDEASATEQFINESTFIRSGGNCPERPGRGVVKAIHLQ